MNRIITIVFISLSLPSYSQTANTFKAQNLLVLSDADMIASTYEDGILNKNFNIEDSLTVITFNGSNYKKDQIHVSNSVISWPAIMTYSTVSKTAYVAESIGVHHIKENRVKVLREELPRGEIISVVDLSNPQNPNLVQKERLGNKVLSVSVNHDGTLLAASTVIEDKGLFLMELENGKIISRYAIDNETFGTNIRASSIFFHPSENILAVNVDNKYLGYYEVVKIDETLQLKQIGQKVKVSIRWSEGKWFKNGDFFAICDYAFTGLAVPRNGSIKTVSFDQKNGDHSIISSVETGLSNEGFDLSPDNNYIISVNMERSFLPLEFPDSLTIKPTLTLIKVNPNNGEMVRLGNNVEFEGALPEDAAFDSESNTIAVVSFHEMGEIHPITGKVEFWEIQDDKLTQLDLVIPLTRGPHALLTIHD